MITIFQDLEDIDNRYNGQLLDDAQGANAILRQLRIQQPPRMIQLIGGNGLNLTIGVASDFGCAQFSANDGSPPYLMAVESDSKSSNGPDMEFIVGGTATPVDGRYRLSNVLVDEIVSTFVLSGERSTLVQWVEFG